MASECECQHGMPGDESDARIVLLIVAPPCDIGGDSRLITVVQIPVVPSVPGIGAEKQTFIAIMLVRRFHR